jgi:5'-3' exoribonuclease 2
MGIPSFLRWLTDTYGGDILRSVSLRLRVPFDVDSFYIDLNGIIHPCCHGVDPKPKTEEEMLHNICKYIDMLVTHVNPKELLFLAIDGVAPRAKMNQQRSRRFFSAREHNFLSEAHGYVKDKFGEEIEDYLEEPWDKNVITPGTPFMHRVSETIKHFILVKMNTDPRWKNVLFLVFFNFYCS